MNNGGTENPGEARPLRPVIAVFFLVAAFQFWLVARVGTDMPIFDEWDANGHWLFPQWLDGTLDWWALFRPHNEHRILFTRLLDLGSFALNGAWDPLVGLFIGVGLRSLCAALVAWVFCAASTPRQWLLCALVVAGGFLPHLAWHNVLWAFESQVFFSLGWALLAFWGWTRPGWCWLAVAVVASACAGLAMGSGYLVPVALLGVSALRVIEQRAWRGESARLAAAAVLLVGMMVLRGGGGSPSETVVGSLAEWLRVWARTQAWPHADGTAAALVVNAPMAVLLGLRLLRRREQRPHEDGVVACWLWATAICASAAWARGGAAEFGFGVPSRYLDFVVLVPLSNLWAGAILLSELRVRRGGLVFGIWCAFLAIGWLGASAETIRGMVIPRLRDPAAPTRMLAEFQKTENRAVYARSPRFYLPHMNLDRVLDVLHDPRMKGRLPPSLQPEHRLGRLSWLARCAAKWCELITAGLAMAGVVTLCWGCRSSRRAVTSRRAAPE